MNDTNLKIASPLDLIKPLNYCRAPECNRKEICKGLCQMHYCRLRLYGRLHSIKRKRGSGGVNSNGYIVLNAGGYKNKLEHVVIVERILGKPLPRGVLIHHINQNRQDNRPENLVVCQNSAYHNLLHARMRALEACGNVNYVRCSRCKTYDDPAQLTVKLWSGRSHRECETRYWKERKLKKLAANLCSQPT